LAIACGSFAKSKACHKRTWAVVPISIETMSAGSNAANAIQASCAGALGVEVTELLEGVPAIAPDD
jgi:hypothetical protein